MDDAYVLVAAAFCTGFFSPIFNAAAGVAASIALVVVFGGQMASKSADDVLRVAPSDIVSTVVLLAIFGLGYLVGNELKNMSDKT